MLDRYETRQEDTVSKQVTLIRVSLGPGARREIEKLVSDSEAMIQRCVWRFIWTKNKEKQVKGELVDFTLGAEEILELFADLRRIDMEEMQRKETEQQSQ
jgi:hypothetical protein